MSFFWTPREIAAERASVFLIRALIFSTSSESISPSLFFRIESSVLCCIFLTTSISVKEKTSQNSFAKSANLTAS